MSNDLIQKIKSLSIVEIIRHYLPLNKKGANYLAICPFHHDTSPSLTINENKNIFKCFVCNVSGNGISFVQKKENITFYQAIIKIAKLFNIDKSLIDTYSDQNKKEFKHERLYLLNKRYLELCQSFLLSEIAKNSDINKYLIQRNITKDIIDKFGIGYNPDGGKTLYELLTNEEGTYVNLPQEDIFTRKEILDANVAFINNNGYVIDTFRNRLVFSIKDKNGNVVGFSGRSMNGQEPKYLNTAKTPIFNKGEILYNWSNIKDDENIKNKLYLVEGFMDAIALYRIGINNVVATMGTAFSENHLKLLKTKNIKTIILAFDNDNAGRQAILSHGNELTKHFNVFVVDSYDPQYKDLDEVLNKLGTESLTQVISKEIHFSLFCLHDLAKKYSSNLFESDKQDFLTKALDIIKTIGDPIHKNDYISFLTYITKYDEVIILSKVANALSNIKFIPVSKNPPGEISVKSKKPSIVKELNKNHYLKAYFNMVDRLLMACLINSEAVNLIKEHYVFYGVTNLSKEFDEVYKRFVNIINLFCDFYMNNANVHQLTKFNIFKLQEFMQDYKDSFDIKIYLKYIEKYMQINESEIFSYQYNKKNILESIKACIINELSLRKLLILDKIDLNSQNNILDNVNNEYTKFNEILNQWMKKTKE